MISIVFVCLHACIQRRRKETRAAERADWVISFLTLLCCYSIINEAAPRAWEMFLLAVFLRGWDVRIVSSKRERERESFVCMVMRRVFNMRVMPGRLSVSWDAAGGCCSLCVGINSKVAIFLRWMRMLSNLTILFANYNATKNYKLAFEMNYFQRLAIHILYTIYIEQGQGNESYRCKVMSSFIVNNERSIA